MDILNNRIVTGKHLSHKYLHLNKTSSTSLAKKILFIGYGNFDSLGNT